MSMPFIGQSMENKPKRMPVWKDDYTKLGVTPEELYMRQQGECWLKTTVLPDKTVRLFCTDGDQSAETRKMLNPTIECANCMACFAIKVVESKLD